MNTHKPAAATNPARYHTLVALRTEDRKLIGLVLRAGKRGGYMGPRYMAKRPWQGEGPQPANPTTHNPTTHNPRGMARVWVYREGKAGPAARMEAERD